MEHNDNILSNYKEKEQIWKPYLVNDVLGLAALIAKHGIIIQKITGVSFKKSLTESSLSWATLGKYLNQEGKSFYTPKNKYVRDFIHKSVHGGRVFALNRRFVSSIFNDILIILEKYSSKKLELSDMIEEYFNRIKKVREYYIKKYESRFNDYRRMDTEEINMLTKNLLVYQFRKN